MHILIVKLENGSYFRLAAEQGGDNHRPGTYEILTDLTAEEVGQLAGGN